MVDLIRLTQSRRSRRNLSRCYTRSHATCHLVSDGRSSHLLGGSWCHRFNKKRVKFLGHIILGMVDVRDRASTSSSRDWSPYYICPPQDSWNRTRFEHITSSEKHAQKVIRSSSRISLVNLHCARRNKGLQRGLVMRSIPATMTRLYDLGVALWNFLLNYDTVWYVLPMLCY